MDYRYCLGLYSDHNLFPSILSGKADIIQCTVIQSQYGVVRVNARYERKPYATSSLVRTCTLDWNCFVWRAYPNIYSDQFMEMVRRTYLDNCGNFYISNYYRVGSLESRFLWNGYHWDKKLDKRLFLFEKETIDASRLCPRPLWRNSSCYVVINLSWTMKSEKYNKKRHTIMHNRNLFTVCYFANGVHRSLCSGRWIRPCFDCAQHSLEILTINYL